jgi:hypothetical protein
MLIQRKNLQKHTFTGTCSSQILLLIERVSYILKETINYKFYTSINNYNDDTVIMLLLFTGVKEREVASEMCTNNTPKSIFVHPCIFYAQFHMGLRKL